MKTRLLIALTLAGLLVVGAPRVALAASTEVTASLAGANEVDPGDPDGSGNALLDVDTDTGEICFRVTVAKVDAPSAAHIHVGGAGQNGDVVVDLDWSNTNGRGCVDATVPVAVAITTSPSLYYVNVHNAEFPAGAVRGQLTSPFAEPTVTLALTGSSTTSLLAAAGIALISTGALMVRVTRRFD